jgi:hypothetical protein
MAQALERVDMIKWQSAATYTVFAWRRGQLFAEMDSTCKIVLLNHQAALQVSCLKPLKFFQRYALGSCRAFLVGATGFPVFKMPTSSLQLQEQIPNIHKHWLRLERRFPKILYLKSCRFNAGHLLGVRSV